MENHKYVLPEHLNHYGYLFGGNLLKWVDEVSWIAASTDFPGCHFVTIALDRVEFRKSIRQGTILRFDIQKAKVGRTSVQYSVKVFDATAGSSEADALFSTNITFVRIDSAGMKCPLDADSCGWPGDGTSEGTGTADMQPRYAVCTTCGRPHPPERLTRRDDEEGMTCLECRAEIEQSGCSE